MGVGLPMLWAPCRMSAVISQFAEPMTSLDRLGGHERGFFSRVSRNPFDKSEHWRNPFDKSVCVCVCVCVIFLSDSPPDRQHPMAAISLRLALILREIIVYAASQWAF